MEVLVVLQNQVDGLPMGTKVQRRTITSIDDVKGLFDTMRIEELERPIKGFTHMVWEGNALYFNDTMTRYLNKIPEHWSNDAGGIMGNVVLFNQVVKNKE